MSQPRVGVAALIHNNGLFLTGKRLSTHGNGYWAFPGGHLEEGESFEECAARETREETGVVVKNFRLVTVTNDLFAEKHYITLFMLGECVSGTPRVLEPDKCEQWQWHAWENLPEPLFLPIVNAKKQGFHPLQPITHISSVSQQQL